MKKRCFLGIDTSNYTTSLALVDEEGTVLANLKKLLPVKQGERGLRQSDALFLHTKQLPELFRELKPSLSDIELSCVGVSSRPRNTEGSYMPCFLAGVSAATAVSATQDIPLYEFSHQSGHIMAALHSSGFDYNNCTGDFLAFHVSGGTTELVRVKNAPDEFEVELLGGTADLNAGQIIDRVGVHLGLPFPSGAHLESYALENTRKIQKKKISRKGLILNLSGLENIAKKIYSETEDKTYVGAFVFDYIARALLELKNEAFAFYGKMPVVFAGGVMSNSIIKNALSSDTDVHFANREVSSDNAVGTALLARKKFLNNN